MRYDQLPELIIRARPKLIVEVGTHRGARAWLMCRAALSCRDDVHYIGYDLFDGATEETNTAEMNGKGSGDIAIVWQQLDLLKNHKPGFSYDLIKGNTRQTLHGKNIIADFAFIDGGHSVETIRGDYEALKNSKYVVFDDYYMRGIDTTKFGCNSVVADIPHTVLPREDVFGSTAIRMVVIFS